MSYIFKTNIANKQNYGGVRALNTIKYLVYHYTGNDGDSDESNGKHFHNHIVKASAHYFVDDDSVTQSVPDNYIAYSVGGKCQSSHHPLYKVCTNSNSISIEMCDCFKNGVVEITDKTIENAIELGRVLMKKYNISIDHVIRHYDVNGKACPNCNGLLNNANWNAFKSRLTGAPVTNDVPNPKPSETPPKPSSYDQWVADLQEELNRQYNMGLVVDGLKGPKTLAACPLVRKGARGNITRLIQRRLNSVGFHLSTDGIFGSGTYNAVNVFQKNRGLYQDEKVGKKTWDWLLKGTKMQVREKTRA